MNTKQVGENGNNIHFDETMIICAPCLHKRLAVA